MNSRMLIVPVAVFTSRWSACSKSGASSGSWRKYAGTFVVMLMISFVAVQEGLSKIDYTSEYYLSRRSSFTYFVILSPYILGSKLYGRPIDTSPWSYYNQDGKP